VKPPRPIFVVLILGLLMFSTLSRGPSGSRSGAESAGYLFGAIFFPAFLALLYTWWYRRRNRPPEV
jgi:hypothetical protein